MKMTGRTVLVAGGTSGIGLALADAFHELGNRVIVAGRREDRLARIVSARPGMAAIRLDVTDPASVAALAREIADRFPEADTLIANAGISRPENLVDGWTPDIAEAIVETNILGTIRTIGALLPHLTRRPGATIMATGSALAFVPLAGFPTYCASKAFLHSWLVSLRHQLRDRSAEVIELSPPYVQTELTGQAQASDPRATPLDEYVDAVMARLEAGAYPAGELLLDGDLPRRHAERDGTFDTIFAAMNPA